MKRLHKYRCQVCGERLETPAGPYAESAHIRPLGRPHDGPDTEGNVLCLCPNHHVLFDSGAIHVDDDFEVINAASGDSLGELRRIRKHAVDRDQLAYHRGLYQSE